ncbi:hypothetical protein [Oleiagrimonas sp. C23AA]|uniref:hypothetical protein n=1 Tax=Oleiagrimonas sp. C23AA TaxID=2719047 RepID=UPI001422B372|nr:hypothetical protein [Oleiagrimonas sp. C23AA]NII09950.1 hypothetical protein [Oleiagrimonas sp. C23AA]
MMRAFRFNDPKGNTVTAKYETREDMGVVLWDVVFTDDSGAVVGMAKSSSPDMAHLEADIRAAAQRHGVGVGAA